MQYVPYLLSIANCVFDCEWASFHFIQARLLAEVEVSNMKTVNLSNYALTTGLQFFFFLNCIMDHKKMLPLSDSRSFLMGSKQAHDYNVWGNYSNVYK